MPELTDEEKAKLAFNDVETAKTADETKEEDTSSTEQASDQQQQVEDKSEETEDKTKDDTETETSETDTLTTQDSTNPTKPFPWLKGETPDDWNKELATAYENSTNEALRMKKQLDDNQAVIEEAKKIIANQTNPSTQKEVTTSTAPSNLAAPITPESQYAKTLMEQDMIKSFNSFADNYPDAREPEAFNRIEAVSTASAQVFTALNGRQPTYSELFEQIAKDLNWQPKVDTSKKDQAIKENAANAASPQSTSYRPPVKGAKVTEDQLSVARRIFPGKTDEEILKDLPNYVNT